MARIGEADESNTAKKNQPHVMAGELEAGNRANWDDRTETHVRSQFYDVEGWLQNKSGPREREVDALGDVTGLSLLHLQCHFGLDTMAWARAGATVTGLDLSPVAIDTARDLAKRAGIDSARFVCASVYDAVDALDHERFDIVYVSLGSLCWLPDVGAWAAQVGSLLSAGGRFYLHDVHPLAWALADDEPSLLHTYFEETDPFVDDSDETYTDSERPLTHTRSYEWNHSLGETVTALIRQGLRIDSLTEHDWTVWPRFPWLVETGHHHWTTPPDVARMPLTYTVLASRPASG